MKANKYFTLLLLPLFCAACSQEKTGLSGSFIEEKLAIHTEEQQAFLSGPYTDIVKYAHGDAEMSRPLSSTLSWKSGKSPYLVTLKDGDGQTTTYTSEENSLAITNLKLNMQYTYTVKDASSATMLEDSFATQDGIVRNLYVDGVTNVRDLGGYAINGKRTKQGVIFRGGRLNENKTEEVTVLVSEQGKKTLLEDFGIKTEIDLRRLDNNEVGTLAEGTRVLGEGVAYYQCPMRYDYKMPGVLNDNGLRKTFGILGKKENYPVYLHCSIGTDRTGYVAWLINAYLGVEEDLLWKDYLFSNYGAIEGSRVVSSISKGYVQKLNNMPGETLSEKAKAYLLEREVEESELNVLREMMLGE